MIYFPEYEVHGIQELADFWPKQRLVVGKVENIWEHCKSNQKYWAYPLRIFKLSNYWNFLSDSVSLVILCVVMDLFELLHNGRVLLDNRIVNVYSIFIQNFIA